ncbi:Uu.00g121960.m01.CDS01 [Anthostomella pinea]|uniref:Uu.00g121960.m01.CDS01 n=1 Tax=Anthostomella pinea TaxID=933095 RepID=A0AAI8YHH7_9PEZI|nr:Uu.00g121960.m01.CDS01 [Anthostomella pinea]
MAPSSLPYHEPPLTYTLVLASFLLALNMVNAVLDRALYCGLVGQVLVGTAWGAPGARWLSSDAGAGVQEAVVGLGYLGLVLVVFEGGLATDVRRLWKDLGLAVGVAGTGVVMPMGFSFVLGKLGGASGLQSFAAGAALCSTSLGTTFTVLSTSGLSATRLGSVLSTAAMMDDVVGLVMVQIISSLGEGAGSGGAEEIAPTTVVRPVFVSLAFAVAVPVVCRFLLRPGLRVLDRKRGKDGGKGGKGEARVWRVFRMKEAAFVVQTLLLIALVVAASYAGVSVLLAAYIAGVLVSWWDAQRGGDDEKPASACVPGQEVTSASGDRETRLPEDAVTPETPGSATATAQPVSKISRYTGHEIYELYYSQAENRVLKPFFFASIGFSIPVSKMFSGEVIWRGMIYTVLMMVGKLLCGLWLVRLPVSMGSLGKVFRSFVASRYHEISSRIRPRSSKSKPKPAAAHGHGLASQPGAASPEATEMSSTQTTDATAPPDPTAEGERHAPKLPAKPVSLYPSAIMAFAMVARGEIGFLISSVAESKGIFRRADESESDASELFLIVTWAIFLCTIVGPLCVGLLVKRVKKLEKASVGPRGARNVLGAWGVQ